MENLANATKESIDSKDITETIDALKVASIITNQSKVVTKKEIKVRRFFNYKHLGCMLFLMITFFNVSPADLEITCLS